MTAFSRSRRNLCGLLGAAWATPAGLSWAASAAAATEPGAACPSSPAHARLRVEADRARTIGINLGEINDWSRTRMLADTIKSSRRFGAADAPWQGIVDTAPDGWPFADDFGVVIMTYGPAEAASLAGAYRLTFQGKARRIEGCPAASVQNVSYDAGRNQTTADVTTRPAFASQGILWLSFKGTGGTVRDLQLMRPGHEPSERFNRAFLKAIEPFRVLRAMDSLAINGNPTVAWNERATPSTAQWSEKRGLPWEVLIELANQTGKDLWINLPARADDDYVRRLAALLHESLCPQAALYVEHGNELWNLAFPQARWNREQAVGEAAARRGALNHDGASHPGQLAARRAARRAKEISEIFRARFGDAAMMTRVRPVLAGQAVNSFFVEQGLDMIRAVYGPPARFFHGLAIAPYFTATQLPATGPVDEEDVIRALQAEAERQREAGWLHKHKALATRHGLQLLAYEGGPDTTGPAHLQAKRQAMASASIGPVIERHLDAWQAAGGGLYMWYSLASDWSSPHGAWGLTENIADLGAPKYLAVAAAARRAP